MNAHTPASLPATTFPPVVLTYTDALRVLAAHDGPMTTAQLAAATDRVLSNLKRDTGRLYDAGVVEWVRLDGDTAVTITNRGRAWLLGQDVAESGQLPVMATLEATAADPDTAALTWIEIQSDPANPRKRSGFSDAEIEDMALSLKAEYEATGKPFITPPTVYPLAADDLVHRVAKGERRWRGWGLAIERGWIPGDLAVICPYYRGDPTQALASAIVENLQRADLDNLEEAEAFAALADQLANTFTNPVPEICRQIGKSGESGERYVQERLRVAAKATPEAKARFIESRRRAATGEADPDPFLWKHLRDSVKIPRHITALDKSPALRLLVLEMGWIGDAVHGMWDGEVRIDLDRTMPGGLLDQAIELDLVEVWPAALLGATATLTQKACAWLAGLGWGEAPEDADLAPFAQIRTLRAELFTPDQLVGLGDAAATPFLNPRPEGEGDHAEHGGEGSADAEPGSPVNDQREDDSGEEIPAYLRRLAGGSATPDPAPRQPTDPERLIITEVAWRADIARGGDGFADAHGIHSDPVAMAMIPHWLLTRMGDGCTRVALTRHAQAWLADYYEGGLTPKDIDAARYAAGKIDFNTVEQLRASGRFATAWLNTPTPPALPGDDAPATDGALDGEAGANASPSPNPQAPPQANLDPVVLMRRALTDLWLAAGHHYDAGATLAGDPTPEAHAHHAATTLTLQRALAAAATFVPAEVKATLETAAHG